jgi:hypothetical protein
MLDKLERFTHKERLRQLVASVIKEASAHGLKCQEIPADERGSRKFRRRLLIEGHRCQIASSRVIHIGGKTSMHAIYAAALPRTYWADFIIHAVRDQDRSQNLSFFVVPRGDASKSTSYSSTDNWLFKYKDAWSLLTDNLPAERLERKVEEFNWKLLFAKQCAAALGLRVDLVKKAGVNSHLHVKNRLVINGCNCQVMALARLSRDSQSERWKYITLHAPKQTWAQFLIFILKAQGSENPHIFIIPRHRIRHTTTTSLAAEWLNRYANSWEVLESDQTS